MRWLLLLLVALAGCTAPAPTDTDTECDPPEVVSASGPEDDGRVRVRVSSSEWAPHALWVDVVDDETGDLLEADEALSAHQPNSEGVVEFFPSNAQPGERAWSVTVIDPAGCEGFGGLTVTVP